jgi:hypothetical protein
LRLTLALTRTLTLTRQEDTLHNLHSWLEATADEMEYSTGGGADDIPSLAPGDPRAFGSQKEFDVELLIERGRAVLDGILDSLVEGSTRISTLHEQVRDVEGSKWDLRGI